MIRYLFVDMNAFFASVEQQEQPRLRGKPIGVVPVMADNTCCIAASYHAKACGVKTGTGVREAKRLCPRIQLVQARPMLYVEYHHRIVKAVESCLHVDHVCSIDEMYGRLLGGERDPERSERIGRAVKDAIAQRVGEQIHCSVGLAPNAWLAKVASDMQKPDGLTLVKREQLPERLYNLELPDLPGIGRRMTHRLYAHGVTTVAELCAMDEADLARIWNSTVLAGVWWRQLRGLDLPFKPTRRRTVGHSHVLPPELRTHDHARTVLARLIHKAARRMRNLGYSAGGMAVSIRFTHGTRWSRRVSLGGAWGGCRDTLTMLQAINPHYRTLPPGNPLKVGITLFDLAPDCGTSAPLFENQRRRDRLSDAIDRIDTKYGKHTLYFAAMFGAQHAAPTRISFTQIPQLGE